MSKSMMSKLMHLLLTKMTSKKQKVLNFSDDRGGWRAERNERVEVADGYDTRAMRDQLVQCSPVFKKAKLAGSGKSYIGEY